MTSSKMILIHNYNKMIIYSKKLHECGIRQLGRQNPKIPEKGEAFKIEKFSKVSA